MIDSNAATGSMRKTWNKKWSRHLAPLPLKAPSIFIAMACSGKGAPIRIEKYPPDVYPVLAGAALHSKPQRDMSFDNFGQNISKGYSLYAELTVTYWLHKNAPDFDYLGLCDEHRCFVITDNHRRALALGKFDVILPRQRIKLPGIEVYFHPDVAESLQPQDYEQMLDILDEKYPDMASCARKIFQQEFKLPSNLLIARNDIFHDYAEFLFSVLQPLQQKNEDNAIYQERHSLRVLGELLTTLYFEYHQEDFKIKRVNSHLLAASHHKH